MTQIRALDGRLVEIPTCWVALVVRFLHNGGSNTYFYESSKHLDDHLLLEVRLGLGGQQLMPRIPPDLGGHLPTWSWGNVAFADVVQSGWIGDNEIAKLWVTKEPAKEEPHHA